MQNEVIGGSRTDDSEVKDSRLRANVHVSSDRVGHRQEPFAPYWPDERLRSAERFREQTGWG